MTTVRANFVYGQKLCPYNIYNTGAKSQYYKYIMESYAMIDYSENSLL